MSVLSYLRVERSNPALIITILMSTVCFNRGGVTIIKNGFILTATTDASLGCKYCTISFAIPLKPFASAGPMTRKDLQGVMEKMIVKGFNLFEFFGSAGLKLRKDLHRMSKIFYKEFYGSYFRLLTAEDFRRNISRRTDEERAKEYTESMRLLIPQPEEMIWGERRAGSKAAMVGEIVGWTPRINTGKDTVCMQRYITRVSKDGLDQPSFMRVRQYLPAEAPLLDYLVEEYEKVDGWKYPRLEDLKFYQANRGLNLDMLKQVEVRELVCGVSSREEILEVGEWIRERYASDQEKFGTGVVSFDVEDVKTTFYDTLRMAGKIQIPGGEAVLRKKVETEAVYGYLKDDWRQVPAKIMFGNGVSWTCLISLGLEVDERYQYIVKKMVIQPEILDLIRDLPVVTGLAIRRDVQGVEEFYSLISGEEVIMERGFVDLTSLAILAGYKLQARNMTAMGVQVMGTLLNKTVSTADDCWGFRWADIPKCLQCYALGDIKFGFITYSVLAGVLLRDVFPDPDVVCRYLKCDQSTAVDWFLEFVLNSLETVEFHQAVEELAETREEMISSLRRRDSRGKLCDSPPSFIRLWLELLGSWPSITFGGCRYLLQCRQWFLVQVRVLARAKVRWTDGRVLELPEEGNLEYSRFGLSMEDIGEQSWSQPVIGARGMVRPPGIRIKLLEFDVSSTKPCEIGRKCTMLGRNQRWSLLEWARLNPGLLRTFFVRMVRDTGFQVHYANLYDGMRLMYKRILDMEAPRVRRVEESLTKSVLKSLSVEKAGLERSEAETRIRRLRVEKLDRLSQDWTYEERTRWSEELPLIPSSKQRESRKRSRSRSKIRLDRSKKRQVQSKEDASLERGVLGEETPIKVSVQPDPGLPGVGNGVDTLHSVPDQGNEREREESGVDSNRVKDLLARLKCRRSVVKPARDRSGSRRILSYDEIIEGPPRVENAYEDLDSVFEIPSDVEDFEV